MNLFLIIPFFWGGGGTFSFGIYTYRKETCNQIINAFLICVSLYICSYIYIVSYHGKESRCLTYLRKETLSLALFPYISTNMFKQCKNNLTYTYKKKNPPRYIFLTHHSPQSKNLLHIKRVFTTSWLYNTETGSQVDPSKGCNCINPCNKSPSYIVIIESAYHYHYTR